MDVVLVGAITTMKRMQGQSYSKTTRRDVLKLGGALAAGVTPGLAGCTSALPPLGSALDFGRLDVPDAGKPTYRQWLPSPDAVPLDEETDYNLQYREPQPVTQRVPFHFMDGWQDMLSILDWFGIGYENYDRILSCPYGIVIEAGFDPVSVSQTLTDSGYTGDGSYHGYDLFTRSDQPRRAAIGDDAIVWSTTQSVPGSNIMSDLQPDVEALIDAKAGRIERYHETNDRFDRLSSAMGASRAVEYESPDGEENPFVGDGFRFDGKTAYQVRRHLYPESERVPEKRLREWFSNEVSLTREITSRQFRSNEQMATVVGRVPPDAGNVKPSDLSLPQITWGGTSDADSRTVEFRHEAGESIASSELIANVLYDWDEDADSRPVTLPVWPDRDVIEPGDAMTITLDEDPTVDGKDVSDHEDFEGFNGFVPGNAYGITLVGWGIRFELPLDGFTDSDTDSDGHVDGVVSA